MPDLLEHMYCSQQINIPPNLPFILKQYAKAAIRTQPYDLLYWSAAYFRAKANNSPPPVKERLEYPPIDTPSRLSPGFLKVLHKQLGENEYVPEEVLTEKWLGVCLVQDALESMLRVGGVQDKVPWLKFVAIAAGHLCANLSKTMVMVCEVLTEEPEGGSAMIPVEVFVDLYQYLARLDCGPPEQLHATEPGSGTSVSFASKTSAPSSKESKESIVMPVDSKDSRAGLMVWEDIKPEETEDRAYSPRHTEAAGAPSQLGLEVYDEATGPVTEVVTLLSAKPQAESEVCIIHSNMSTDQVQKNLMVEFTMSHPSLHENTDWINVKQQSLYNYLGDSLLNPVQYHTDKLDAETTEVLAEEGTSTENNGEPEDDGSAEELKTHEDSKEADVESFERAVEIEGAEDKTDLVEVKTSEEGEKEALETGESEPSKTSEQLENEEDSNEPEAIEDGKKTFSIHEAYEPSEDSVVGLGESITVQHFIKDDLKSSTGLYSTAEIRKGYYNDKSESKLERNSSENTVKAAETVHLFSTVAKSSADFVAQERKTQEQVRESESLSDQGSDNFTELPPEDRWKDVPGIGPVIPEPQIIAVVEYMHYWAAKQQGMVMPRNVNHILCPPLDLPPPDESTC